MKEEQNSKFSLKKKKKKTKTTPNPTSFIKIRCQ